ncbi:MAG: fimbrillin family protein, partial [Alistipes sp.]|nr:fimbrillin family protein [Alistipes sp.]
SKNLSISNEPDAPNEFERIQLRLTGNIMYMTPDTRVDDEGFEDGDGIGVYVSTGSLKGSGNKVNNVKYTYKAANSEIVAPEGGEIYWDNDNTAYNIYAYYPYANQADGPKEVLYSVNEDQSTSKDYYKSDFLRAYAESIKKTSKPVELTFNHLMSKILLTITPDDTFDNDEFEEATKAVKIGNVPYTGIINLADGTVTGKETNTKTITALAGENNTFSAIVFPLNATDVKFSIEIEGKSYSATLPSASFASGKVYSYSLSVTNSSKSLRLNGSNINEWNPASSVDGLEMTEDTSN